MQCSLFKFAFALNSVLLFWRLLVYWVPSQYVTECSAFSSSSGKYYSCRCNIVLLQLLLMFVGTMYLEPWLFLLIILYLCYIIIFIKMFITLVNNVCVCVHACICARAHMRAHAMNHGCYDCSKWMVVV